MSIFKETFPEFVRKQLELREDIISSGAGRRVVTATVNAGITLDSTENFGFAPEKKAFFNFNEKNRENDFFTYTLNKQCTLRMSSGVNVTDQALLKDLTNSDQIQNSQFILNQDSIPGYSLAEQFVLQGGVRTLDPQGGIGEGGAYGDPNLAANSGGNGLGIVPMPGIIDATISTKSAYGSLREAKVKFVAHNKKQLQILETLYMRPGYTLLLEWGWSPYFILDTEGNRTKQTFIPFVPNFFQNTTTEALEKLIFESKEDSQGNYDALLGYCKNFSYSLRPDGGFNCETEIIAKGEVIESLKDEESRSPVSNDDIKYTYSPRTLILLDKIRQYSVNKSDAENVTIQSPFKRYAWSNAFETAGTEKRRVELFSNGLMEDLELEDKAELSKFIITKNEEDKGWDWGNNETAIRSETTYIRWDALCFLMNKYIIPTDSNGKPLFSLQTNRLSNDGEKIETLKYVDIVPNKIKKNASNLRMEEWSENGTKVETKSINWNIADVSVNPMMFQFPHILFKQPSELLGGYKNKIYDKLYQPLAKQLADTSPKEVKLNIFDKDKKKFLDIDGTLGEEEINYSIGGIYIGVEYLISTFKSMYYDEIGAIKDDYSLFNFIKKIWEDINGACNNNHEFDIHVENNASGKILRIVDFIVDAGEVDLENVHELKIQSLDSVVRDIVYNTNLPSALSTTIAVAAQAPDSIDNLDKVSFAAISENIQDRFAAPIKTDNIPSEDQIKRWEASFNKAIRELEAISYIIGNYRDLDTGEIGNSVLYDKKSGVLTDFVLDVDEKSNQYSDEESFEDFSKYRGAVGQVRRSIDYLYKVYWHTNKDQNIYQGQPIPDPVPRLSAVIPLQFNVKMDGISGIVMGNVFKLPKNRLPFSYREDDIYFIVMGEEQSISSKQDWTTSIKGQLILLRSEEDIKNTMEDNWKNLNGILTTKKTEQEVRMEEDGTDAFAEFAEEKPWSAAFISSMVKQAGGFGFPYNASHVNYSLGVKKNPGRWKALDPLTTSLKEGDIIVKNRDSSTNEFNNITPSSNSHGDIVVGVNRDNVKIVGGNLGKGTVKLTTLKTFSNSPKQGVTLEEYIDIDDIALSEKSLDNLNGNRKVDGNKSFIINRRNDYRKDQYFIILRCDEDKIGSKLTEQCDDAITKWSGYTETDPEIAEILYNYYLNVGMNPPQPYSMLQTS